jgi:hypothetical protein
MPTVTKNPQRQARSSGPVKKSKSSQAKGHAMPEKNGDAATGENLDKVRDILFGSQMRDQDKRFARLEEKLAKEITDVRDESRRRLDTLEAFIKKELQTVLERIKQEKADRTESVGEVARELKEASKAIEKRIVQSDEKHAAAESEIREELLDQSKSLRDELLRAQQEIQVAMDKATKALAHEKADRSALANLFNELAVRLSDEDSK